MRLLVDISGLAYRSAHKIRLSDREGNPVGVVFGTLRSLEYLAEAIEPEEMVICWDGGYRARSALYPEYKQNRQRDPEFVEDFKRQMGILRDITDQLPVVNILEPEVEADDCIAVVSGFLRLEDVGIVTGDRDLYQLASGQARGREEDKRGRHVIFDYDGVPAKLDFLPSQYVTYKVLVGDSSDNIKGVLGLGDKRARALIEEFRTLKRIMAWARAEPAERRLGRMTYQEAVPIVKRNLQLIRLTGAPLLDKDQKKRILSGYTHGRLHRQLREAQLRDRFTVLGFKSILRRFSKILIQFKPMERIPQYVKAEQQDAKVHPQGAEDVPRPLAPDRVGHGGVVEGRGCHPGYLRRIRKIRVPGPRGGRRPRRVRRVVRHGREGHEAGDGDHDPARRTPDEDHRDAQSAELAAQVGHPRPPRALPALVRQARASRARARNSRISRVQELLQSEPLRRDGAVSLLSAFGRDREWLLQQTDGDLRRILRIIRAVEGGYPVPQDPEDAEFIRGMNERMLLQMPKWMQTKEDTAGSPEPGTFADRAARAIAARARRLK